MGAWIEIGLCLFTYFLTSRRTPRWVRGLKFIMRELWGLIYGSRTPRWVRGLKFVLPILLKSYLLSHPTMGAWIEIFCKWH